MRSGILCLLLALLTTPVMAEWVSMGMTEDGEGEVYLDPATIRKDGKLRKVWELVDNKQSKLSGEMSSRTHVEYDCGESRYRNLTRTTHSAPMAAGRILMMGLEAGEWSPISPRSASESALKLVCSK